MSRKYFRLGIEQLEDRCVPAVTGRTISGSLFLSGTPRGEVDITYVPLSGMFKVTDNGNLVGNYNILDNLYVELTNERGDVKIDLNGGTLPGNVLVSLGTGYVGAQPAGAYSVDLYDDSVSDLGMVLGNIDILGGNGLETMNIGNKQTNPAETVTTDPVTILGDVIVSVSKSRYGQGNALSIGDGTQIVGSLITSQVSQVEIGTLTPTATTAASIGGDVTINDYGSLVHLTVADFGYVGENLNVTGTVLDDTFSLQTNGLTGSGEVDGSLSVNLYQGQAAGDQIMLGNNSLVEGNAYVTAGTNLNTVTGDQFYVLGTVDENLTVAMGNSRNSLYFGAQAPGDLDPFVGANMTVTAGNGVNIIGQVATQEFTGTINGNLSITLGSGNNGVAVTDPMVIAPLLNGDFTWRSGNGQDVLQLGNITTGTPENPQPPFDNYNVNILFGNNNDSFYLDIGAAGVLTGRVNGGGHTMTGINTLVTYSGSPASPTVITNFS